jgi:polyisoprenyl-teichoic acid--peptidoglycan teichoic acid transferase
MKSSTRLLLLLFITFISVFPLRAQETSLTISDPDAMPDPMPMLDNAGYDIENFLLLGSDTTNPVNAGRTDVMVIVSVNRSAGTVSMLSIPRDLYVYIPGHRVYRINSAYGYGEHDGTGGFQLLSDTIRYNLGIKIDHYARVDFSDFKDIIDALGGVEISVDCAIQDWRLKEPDLAQSVADNWQMFTLPVGVYQMDGDLALWYARSRRTSSDFDRGRRHQALLRALWGRIRSLNLVSQLADIWPQAIETVQTDIGLDDMLNLVPMALSLDPSRIASYTFRPNVETKSWLSPEGSDVLVPQRSAIRTLEQQLIEPPTEHQLVRENSRVEIVNASGTQSFGQVAADRLAWEGFVPQISTETPAYQAKTMIYDFTGQSKGSSLATLEAALRINNSNVVVTPDPNRAADFRVVLGGSYSSCTYNVALPK